MTEVTIDGKALTNILSVSVNLTRNNDGRGELVGDPPPVHIVIRRGCSSKADAQLAPFVAAKKKPKAVALMIKMPNHGAGESIVFDVSNAFVSEWNLENESMKLAFETMQIYAGSCKLTVGAQNETYSLTMFKIPK